MKEIFKHHCPVRLNFLLCALITLQPYNISLKSLQLQGSLNTSKKQENFTYVNRVRTKSLSDLKLLFNDSALRITAFYLLNPIIGAVGAHSNQGTKKDSDTKLKALMRDGGVSQGRYEC